MKLSAEQLQCMVVMAAVYILKIQHLAQTLALHRANPSSLAFPERPTVVNAGQVCVLSCAVEAVLIFQPELDRSHELSELTL